MHTTVKNNITVSYTFDYGARAHFSYNFVAYSILRDFTKLYSLINVQLKQNCTPITVDKRPGAKIVSIYSSPPPSLPSRQEAYRLCLFYFDFERLLLECLDRYDHLGPLERTIQVYRHRKL